MSDEIVFRLTVKQQVLPMFALVPIPLIQLVVGQWQLAAFLLVLYTLPFAWTYRFGATISPAGIVVRGFTRRLVPWHEIRWIDTRSLLGGTCIQLHLMSGRRMRLRAPMTGLAQKDPEFWPKLATIQHWWRFYTGQLGLPPEYRAPLAGEL